ncbi:PIN domain-containing protein [Aquirufa regiilacus]|uniref:PIN domain-containing protein n=1 Tax=Aquirufa regiilacus TaxID=3024868 RepID=A0ABU3TTP1_9BACT|nr:MULTISPECIES: PIN domain-containing protein [unclassified Aquirufa]MDT8886174.1 PIN domain-containing protein [Aquirufa sp. LEPPI-3A]MDU0809236.1 PIN domain-containing protein [Aquirufa sp. LEOWEIH-7C]
MIKAVLDACVIYPAPLRDLLLSLADVGLFKPFWSAKINEEWIRNLLIKRPELSLPKLALTIEAMNKAFPDANVSSDANIISSVSLPDQDDIHVLATAISSDSSYIITFNLKDFPNDQLRQFYIEAINPDSFILNLFREQEALANFALENQIKRLKHPPLSKTEVLAIFEKLGLIQTSHYIKGL